jgi:hypothetical protein
MLQILFISQVPSKFVLMKDSLICSYSETKNSLKIKILQRTFFKPSTNQTNCTIKEMNLIFITQSFSYFSQ